MNNRFLTALLILTDALIFLVVWFGLYHIRRWLAEEGHLSVPINSIANYQMASTIYLPFWLTVAWYHRLYSHQGRLNSINQLSAILKTFIFGLAGSLAVAYLFKQWDIGRFILLLTAPTICCWLYFSRTILRHWKQTRYRNGIGVTNVIVIGLGRTAKRVARHITRHPFGGYRFLGHVDHRHRRRGAVPTVDAPVLGAVSELPALLKNHNVQEVFLASPALSQEEILNLIAECEHSAVEFKIVGNLFEVISNDVQIDEIDEIPVIHLKNASLPPMQAGLKRCLDVVVSAALLALFAIPMLIIAILIRLDSPGPALFRQKRIGLAGNPFYMYKFRTMITSTQPYAMAPSDASDPRVTRIGVTLRKFSLDEFPQLINVLIGDMSMVGPRPEMPFLVEKYSPWEKRRLDVKPGITGLWQIVGRKNLPLSLNMEYDFYYIKNQSLFFDILILIKTIPAVIFGRGAY